MPTPATDPIPVAPELGVDPEARIPDILRSHPTLRGVLDRYGLRGCGGPLGPNETLRYFARAHGVDEERLLVELREALARGRAGAAGEAPPAIEYHPGPADTIYRRFFKAGIAIVLSAGAVWGALLLLRIGFSGTFGSVSIHDVNAHGHAQIFGWLGLFVMGFAYQAFPRFLHTELPAPRLAIATFWLMVAGIVIRVVSEPFAPGSPLLIGAGLAAGALELAAISAFVGIMLTTIRRSGKRIEPFAAYAIAGFAFFFLQAVADVSLFFMTATTADVAGAVARYQPALRDLQIHGFAMLMVLGVSQKFFPAMYGYPAIESGTAWRLLPVIVVGVMAEAGGWIAMRTSGGSFATVSGLVAWSGGLALAIAACTAVHRMDVLHAGLEPDRSTKFYRAAFGWLLVSLVMLVAMPWYLEATGQAFSHAYAGAVRHAITVGFLSLMILGVAAKVVPTLCGVDVRAESSLLLPFVLVNLGCSMRVGFQVLTDFRPDVAFPIAGTSGLLEVAGIGIWGIGLWKVMNRRASEDAAATIAVRPTSVTPQTKVGPLVDAAPDLLPIFLGRGFRPLANPMFRRTLGRTVSIAQACAMHGIDANALVAELDRALARNDGGAAEPDGAIGPETTVAEVVRRFPGTAPVFAARKIDACCGGTKPLAEVASRHGIPLADLIADLESHR